jgi:hypothetical protein
MMPKTGKRERRTGMTLFIAAALLSLSFTALAISVNLSADRNGTYADENLTQITMLENESVKFQIQVYEGTETSSGAFSIYKEVAEKTYKLVGKPHFAYAACSCKGSREMPDLNEEYTFIPLSPGKYLAEAQYGGVSRKIGVTVNEIARPAPTTTTTTTQKSTSTTAASTSATEQSTTTSTTTPMGTLPSTTLGEARISTTTYPANVEKTQSAFPWLPALLGLAVFCAYVYFAVNKKKRGIK